MITDPLIARLAAANPLPAITRLDPPTLRPARHRPIRLVVVLAVIAVGVPAVAFASSIGGLFGVSNEGTPVAATDTPFSTISGLNEAMQGLGVPSTLQLLGQRGETSFYLARNAAGDYCVGIDSQAGTGLGCDLTGKFPSAERPILDFSRFSDGAHVKGFAADGIADVALLDATGATIATVPVSGNFYDLESPPPGGTAIAALDASGAVVYQRTFGQAP